MSEQSDRDFYPILAWAPSLMLIALGLFVAGGMVATGRPVGYFILVGIVPLVINALTGIVDLARGDVP